MDLGFREPEADLREGSEKGQMLCSKVTWMFLLHPQSDHPSGYSFFFNFKYSTLFWDKLINSVVVVSGEQ